MTLLVALGMLLAACGNPSAGGPPGSDAAVAPSASEPEAAAPADEATDEPLPPVGEPGTLSVWTYLAPDDPSVAAYIEQFQKQNPEIKVKYTAFPEDNYQDKIRTALQAKSPPDIAIIEDRAWMKAGLVEELSTHYKAWGVDPKDFNPGGMARAAPEGDISDGVYAVGDFLGGNIIFYNKGMFDQAGIPYPRSDRSLTYQEYADICRKLGKPDPDPTKTIYGCSMPEWGFGIYSKWIYGDDGRTATGNLNSPAAVEAWNIGAALVRDKYAPNANILETLAAGESDLFAQGKLGMTWSDFTEASKYTAQNIKFGMMPFYVWEGSESFVDTWTTPWGTFKDSKNKDAALKFLQFIATDAQRIRVETSSDPPLSTKVATELNYGQGDPVKQDYLKVLQQAKRQIFIPPLPEGAWDPVEIYRRMTAEGETDAKPLLDEAATTTQPLLDQAWQEWEKLGQ